MTAAPVKQVKSGAPAVHPAVTGANKVVDAARLVGINQTSFSAASKYSVESIPLFDGVRGNTSFLKPKAKQIGTDVSAEITLMFRLQGKWPSGEIEQFATLRSTWVIRYAFEDRAIPELEAHLSDFLTCYAPFHLWGYWREFVQTSLSRLELPTLTLPLFRITAAPSLMVADKRGSPIEEG